METLVTSRRRVVVTGAAGGIGTAVVPLLPAAWELVLTDLRAAGSVVSLDVTEPAACRAAFAGADAVVHLAGNPDPQAGWPDLRGPNVEGVQVVAVACAEQAVRRLVLASSIQALSARPAAEQVRAGDPPRPANLYGATKAWAEAIGSWIGATTKTSVVALRIGDFRTRPPTDPRDAPFDRSAWLSPRDAAELIRAAVEGPVDGFAVVSGVSANRHRRALYGDAERALGYRPLDDAWDRH
jgi:uronate dehydrogenase